MGIENWTDDQLALMEQRYRNANKTEGGRYSLPEVLLERRRRLPSVQGPREVAARIIALAKTSPDGFTTYGDLWKSFNPGIPWKGNYTQNLVAKSLGRVIHYCVSNNLPILTVLVRRNNKKLSNKAVENICNECRELGIQIETDHLAFVEQQARLARDVVLGNLPVE